MGGGNAQKSATARARKAKKAGKSNQKDAGAEAKQKANQTAHTCKRCFQTFASTTQRKELIEHCDNKHSAQGFDFCFPGFVDPPAKKGKDKKGKGKGKK